MPSMNELLAALTMGAGGAGETYLKYKGKEKDTQEDIARALGILQEKHLFEKSTGEFDLNRRLKEAQIKAMEKGGGGDSLNNIMRLSQKVAEAQDYVDQIDKAGGPYDTKYREMKFIAGYGEKKSEWAPDRNQQLIEALLRRSGGQPSGQTDVPALGTPEAENRIKITMEANPSMSREEVISQLQARGRIR